MAKYFKESSTKYFNDTLTHFGSTKSVPLENQIIQEENALQRQGVKPPPVATRGTLDRIFDAISITSYPIINAIKSGVEMKQAAGSGSDILGAIGKGAWEGVKASNPFGEGYKEGEAQFSQVLDQLGFTSDSSEKWYTPRNVAHGILGFTGDVGLDPTTYMTFGTGALLRGTGKTIGKKSAKELGEKAFREGFEKLEQGGAKNILTGFAQDASDDSVKSLLGKVERRAGYAPKTGEGISIGIGKKRLTFIDDKTMRELGDKWIAPHVNELLAKIGESKVGKGTQKYFRSSATINAIKGARENPEEYAKLIARQDWEKDSYKSFKDLQTKFKQNAEALFDGIDDDTQRAMSRLMENKDMFDKVTEYAKSGSYTLKKTPEAQAVYDDLLKQKDKIQSILDKYNELGVKNQTVTTYEDVMKVINSLNRTRTAEYDKLLSKTKRLGILSGKAKESVYDFLNKFTHNDATQIGDELKKMGIEDPYEAGLELRGLLDRSQRDIEPEVRKYFTGQKFVKPVQSMNVGKPYTSRMDDESVNRMMMDNFDDAQGWNTRIDNSVSQDEWKKKGQATREAHEARLQRVHEGQASLQKWWDKRNVVSAVKRAEEAKLAKADARSAMIDSIARYQVANAKQTDPTLNKLAYNEIVTKLNSKDSVYVERLYYNLMPERKKIADKKLLDETGRRYFDANKEVDSGLANGMADYQETRRFSKNAKEYAGQDDEALHLWDDEQPYTSAEQGVKWKNADGELSEQGKYFKEKSYGKMEDNFGKKEVAQNEYNVHGTKIYEPVNGGTDVKPNMIVEGLRKVAKVNPKLSNFIGQLEVRLTDINHWAESVTGDRKILFGKNGSSDLTNHIKNEVMPHEIAHNFGRYVDELLYSDESIYNDWLSAIEREKRDKETGKLVDNVGNVLKNGLVIREMPDKVTKEIKPVINYKLMHEDFAESFVQYVNNPVKFKQEHPARFSTMQDALKRFEVPQVYDAQRKPIKIDRNPGAQNVTIPKTAKEVTKERLAGIKTKRDNLVSQIAQDGVDETTAKGKLQELDELTDKEGANAMFDELFAKKNPHDLGYEWVEGIIENTSKKLDTGRPEYQKFVKDVLGNNPDPDMAKRLNTVMETLRQYWDVLGRSENIDNMLENYVPHMKTNREFSPEELEKLKESGYQFTDENVHNLERRYKMTIDEFNNMMKKTTGVKENVWEDRIGQLYVMRGLKHNQLMFSKRSYDNLVMNFGKTFDNVKDIPLDKKIFASAEDIKAILDKAKTPDIDKIIERLKLPKDFANTFKPIVEIDRDAFHAFKELDEKFSAFGLSDMLVDHINRAGMLQLDQTKGMLATAYDRFLRLWKISNTSLNPGFHVRNAISNTFQNYLNVGNMALNPSVQYDAAKLNSKDEQYLASKIIKTANGKEYTLKQIQDAMYKYDAVSQGRFVDEFKGVDDVPEDVYTTLTQLANQQGLYTRQKHNFNPLAPLLTDKREEQFVGAQIGRNVGSAVENHARTVNFLANVLNGKDFREAAEMTNKYLFDYSDLSDFEQHVMKRIIPFYTWMRKNIPLQLEHVLSHPNIYKNINRASKDISDMTPEDERVSERDKNQFAQEWMQLPFNTIGKSGKAEPTFFNQYGVIPVGDLNKLDARPAQAVKNVLTSMTPLAKLPLEIGMNKNLYFDSPISRGIGDTDDIPGVAQIPGRIMSAIQGEDYKPSQMSPELRYLLRNLNLLGSENIGKIIESSGETSSDQPMSDRALAAMSYATGMKSYSYDVDKYKEWAYRDRLKTLRDIKKREQMKRANKS